MSIGYACLNIGTPNTNIRSVMQKNATPEKLTEVTTHNLEALEKMVDYNRKNDIRLFRISSDLIPFGSSPVNALAWSEIHNEAFHRIGAKIRKSGMRVSFHPGQYTVLNSPTKMSWRALSSISFTTTKCWSVSAPTRPTKSSCMSAASMGIKKPHWSASQRISNACRKLSKTG